jgi:hypothetical protein
MQTPLVPMASAAEPRGSPSRLVAAREQLDLAVQASSVQAWTEASQLANDPLLSDNALLPMLDTCTDAPATKQEVLSQVAGMRDRFAVLNTPGGPVSNDDAMRAMSDGTMARASLETFMKVNCGNVNSGP